MCGIFGFAGPWTFRAAALLQALAIADESRGTHSTGLALLAKDGSKVTPILTKKALRGSEFVRQGYTSVLFAKKYGLAIGHNRYATAGAITDRNAHPFLIRTPRGAAFAAHNGCVGGKEAIATRYGVQDVAVDSEVFFRAIGRRSGSSEAELLDAIDEVVRFVSDRGDFACLWLEPSKPRAIYFWRSNERPLAVFDARKLGIGRFLASTAEIFTNAWGSVRGALGSVSKVSTWETKPFTIYRVVDDGTWEIEPLRRIRRATTAAVPPSQRAFPWPDLAAEEGAEEPARYFDCLVCREPVDANEAVLADPHTGRPSSSGKPHHESCLAAWGGSSSEVG